MDPSYRPRAMAAFRTGGLLLLSWCWTSSVGTCQENAVVQPVVEIVDAVFGSGRAAGKCTSQIAAIVQDPNKVSLITSSGLRLGNPSGKFRDWLRITYRVDGKQGKLELKNGVKVNIREEILKHSATLPAEAAIPPTAGETSENNAEVMPPEDPGDATKGLPVQPSAADVTVRLPGKADQMRAGGGGRYLIFRIPERQVLAVLDLEQKKMVKEVAAPANAAFAANSQHLAIALPRENQLQRWSLESLEREQVAPLDRDRLPQVAVMGSAGNGPLVLWGDKDVQLWDMETLKPMQMKGPVLHGSPDYGFQLSVSADGKTFCGWEPGLSPTPFRMMRVDGQQSVVLESGGHGMANRWALPVADGSALLNYDGTVSGYDLGPFPVTFANDTDLLPTDDPRFVLAVRREGKDVLCSTLCTASDFRPLCELEGFEQAVDDSDSQQFGLLNGEPSLRYFPESGMLACLLVDREQVVLREFRLETALRHSRPEFLHVLSKPPASVVSGQDYEYQLEVLSSPAEVRYSLAMGPDGMGITPDGKLTWKAKAAARDEIVSVMVEASNSSGQTATHSFGIAVLAGKGMLFAGRTEPEPVRNNELAALIPDFYPDEIGGLNAASFPTQQVFQLPGTLEAMKAGGNGRLLVLKVKDHPGLLIFDIGKVEVAREIEAPADAIFAAGSQKLLVVRPRFDDLQRWDLGSGQLEETVSLDGRGVPRLAVMGSNSEGPLALVHGEGQISWWDIATMKPTSFEGERLEGSKDLTIELVVSADGQTFCSWRTGSTGQTYSVMRLRNGQATVRETPDAQDNFGHWAMPNADGSQLVRSDGQVCAADLKPADKPKFDDRTIFPADSPEYLLLLQQQGKDRSRVTFCSASDSVPLLTISDLDGVTTDRGNWGRLGLERRVRFLPDDKKLVVVPEANDRIMVLDVDLPSMLKETGQSYLLVTSRPPSETTVGQTFQYSVKVEPGDADVRYSIDKAPPGMEVSPEGKVTWKVDARPLGGTVKALVLVEDKTGNRFEHHLDLTVHRDIDSQAKALERRGFVAVDENRFELPHRPTCIAPGLEGRTLVLGGNQLAIVGKDGWTIEESMILGRDYTEIGERRDYYVAITGKPCEVHVIEKRSGKVEKSLAVAARKLTGLCLHPQLPISYVAGDRDSELPHNRFVVFDERSGEGLENENWVGNWLQVDPAGEYLVTQYSDIYERGSRLLLNPDRWHVVPEYGNIDWLIRYRLDRKGMPQFEDVNNKIGSNGKGLRLSTVGNRAACLSWGGYPNGSGDLASWDTDQLEKLPTVYRAGVREKNFDLAFHPDLPLVATWSEEGGFRMFDQETGQAMEGRIPGFASDDPPAKVHRIWFAGNGKSLVADTEINEVHYLYRMPITLEPGDLKLAGKAKKREETRAKENVEKSSLWPLADLDAFAGGAGSTLNAAAIARDSLDSVVVVESGNSTGSGFVVGAGGYILTCAHCIAGSGKATVRWSDPEGHVQSAEAALLGTDEANDIALLRVKQGRPFKPVRLAVGYPVQTGNPVFVIGNPALGNSVLDRSMTEGIVSTPAREVDGQTLIQFTASVNPGSSGGPVFNDRGQVTGMVAIKGNIEAAGFAIPADIIAKFLVSQLKSEPGAMALTRTWFDAAGEKPLEAVLVGLEKGSIRIRRKSDGREFLLAPEKLSPADREFLRILASRVQGDP